jgi:hypothetical protein
MLAGASMALILRHGLETNPDFQARLSFLAGHRALWAFAWLTWTVAALAILNFYDALARAHQLSRFAVLLTAAALGPDLAAQAVEIGVLPSLTDRADLFLILHRVAVLMSGYVANGLYSLSALVLAWRSRAAYPPWVWSAGLAAGAFGFILSAAALVDWTAGMFWSNVFLVPAIIVWLAGVAYSESLTARQSEPQERFKSS